MVKTWGRQSGWLCFFNPSCRRIPMTLVSSSHRSQDARQLALNGLQSVQQGAFADAALDQVLQRDRLQPADRRLLTELLYGCVRRSRTLDALIDQLAKRPAQQQPPKLRLILHLGLYQLRYLNQIPAAAAVDTSVRLAKQNGFAGLSGFVNGILRQYLRQRETRPDPLSLPSDPVQRLGILHSYPDWIVQVWQEQFGLEETEQLCRWMNRPPHLDLRINSQITTLEQVEAALTSAGLTCQRIAGIPEGLRLPLGVGAIRELPGFAEGWWWVQDASAQLVGQLLDAQPGETVIDACAAPGGKTMHLAAQVGEVGLVWACDRSPNRLQKLQENLTRLHRTNVRIQTGDSRSFNQFVGSADRVLLDAPCSGLGTLHRHADARWRQSPDSVEQLAQLQQELLDNTATWVKPGGTLLYSTCTLHPRENQTVIQTFLDQHPEWQQVPLRSPFSPSPQPYLTILPHHQDMDGFFIARLEKTPQPTPSTP